MKHTKQENYSPEQLTDAAIRDQETDRNCAVRDGLFTYAEECHARLTQLGAMRIVGVCTPEKVAAILKDGRSVCRRIDAPPSPPARALADSTCWRVAFGSFVTWYMDRARARDNFYSEAQQGGRPVWLVSPQGETEAYAGPMCARCLGGGKEPLECADREVFEKRQGQ